MKPKMLIFVYHYAFLFSLAAISGITLFVFKGNGTEEAQTPISLTLPLVLLVGGIGALRIAKKFIFPDSEKPAVGDSQKKLMEYHEALKKAVAVFIPCAEAPYIVGFMVYATHKNLTEFGYFVTVSGIIYLLGAWNLNQLKGEIEKLSAHHVL
jgi:hypothetical protein